MFNQNEKNMFESYLKDKIKNSPYNVIDEMQRNIIQQYARQKDEFIRSKLVYALNEYVKADIEDDITSQNLADYLNDNGFCLVQVDGFEDFAQPMITTGDKTSLTVNHTFNFNKLIIVDKNEMAYTCTGIIAPFSEIFKQIQLVENVSKRYDR